MKTIIPVLTALLLTTRLCPGAESFPSGSAEIDRYRAAVKASPTTPDDYQQRMLMLSLWLNIAQQRGANTHALFDSDQAYYTREQKLVSARGEKRKQLLQEICAAVDANYRDMEEVFRKLNKEGPISKPFRGDPANAPRGGNLQAEWRMFQKDKHNSGFTDAPGPKTGELAWKFPVGLGWYARPVIESDRVYVGSPGMQTTSLCLDLKTGEEIWKSIQHHERVGVYKYPAIMSTPVVLQDRIVLRELNSHGGNEGQAKNLVYVDKKTGETLARKYAGHIDYRTQVAPVASNGKHMVYPFGVHDIYSSPAICQNLNRIICADVNNERKLWDLNVGDIDVLAEPVVTATRILQGTTDGYLYALNLEGLNDDRIAWKFQAKGAIHTAVTLDHGTIYFGSNGGEVYALNEADGTLRWKTAVDPVALGARKQFSVPLVADGKVYVGSASKHLYCLDAASGRVRWKTRLSDWIRAKPALTSHGILVATVDGKLAGVDREGQVKWTKQVSTHQFYADLVASGDTVLLSDSDLWLRCMNSKGELLWKRSLLNAYENEQGERIFTDALAGGTYYQSKPTAADGKIYFGNPGGFLFCVDAETGAELWKFEMGGAISVAPALYDGKVYAGQQGGERFFYCVDAKTGELVWKQTVPGGWVWGSATADDGLVYVPTVSGYAICLDAGNGHIVWMYPMAKSLPAEPAIDGDLVYFSSWSHSLYAFNKKTGDIVWKQSGIGLDSGTLIARDGDIHVPNNSDMFKYLDAKTGEVRCQGIKDAKDKLKARNFNATPVAYNGRGYYTARAGTGLGGVPLATRIYCVDYKTAEIYWTFPDGGGISAPAIASNRVYVASGSSPFLYCLDAITGKPYWIYKLGQHTDEATLCIYRDKVYVLAADGYVHAIK